MLLVGACWIGQYLQLSGDLRKFMPRRDRLAPIKRIRAAAAAGIIRMRAVGVCAFGMKTVMGNAL